MRVNKNSWFSSYSSALFTWLPGQCVIFLKYNFVNTKTKINRGRELFKIPPFRLYFSSLQRKTATTTRSILTLTWLSKDSGTPHHCVKLWLPWCWVRNLMWKSKGPTRKMPALGTNGRPAGKSPVCSGPPLFLKHAGQTWAFKMESSLSGANQHFASYTVILKSSGKSHCLVYREKYPLKCSPRQNRKCEEQLKIHRHSF